MNISKMEINDSLIKFGLANVRALKNKDQALLDYILGISNWCVPGNWDLA